MRRISIFVRDFFTVYSEALVGESFSFYLFVYIPGLIHNLRLFLFCSLSILVM